MQNIFSLLLSKEKLSIEDFLLILQHQNDKNDKGISLADLCKIKANQLRIDNFGNEIFIRGLIEISSFCKNDCFYCGLRRSNTKCQRYRLTENEIIECCKQGYNLGFRTFVLQGGEDSYFSDERLCKLITSIKELFPECALTLSLGEKEKSSFDLFKKSGADRYLLRHETADTEHYKQLHPEELSLEHRKQCLFNLKELGFQTGSGFMVGSPYQTLNNLAKDLFFLQELQPEMIGIGPFIPHNQTPFANYPIGNCKLTLFILSLLRIRHPKALIPSTTALNSACENGRLEGILHGANVVMPNLSPIDKRDKYSLYNNKKSSNAEAAEGLELLKQELNSISCTISISKGDFKR